MSRSGTIDSTKLQERFLAAFIRCGSVIKAARASRLNRQAHYQWMRNDPGYPEKFRAAELEAARTLEDEAVRRAYEGVRRAVYYKGKRVATQLEYSDPLLMFLLRANNPAKFTPASKHEFAGKDGGPIALSLQDIDAMRAESEGAE